MLSDLVGRLADRRLDGWYGLPADLTPEPPAEPPALTWLGGACEAALLTHLDDPRPDAWARAWLRSGLVVLVDVAWRDPPGLEALEALGPPGARGACTDGLAAAEEWLYAERGLAAIVGPRRIRHLLGFAATDAATYGERLRPDFTTRRR
ncbi:hypothetical protein GCM10009555_058390 [Acrocarpospora macrocephala]|uniref:Uncharacterized protein n=1 Tax=Acrocarpospora macrocephala TaxID=150177 RepID=A0A5M3WTS9_9ACTN|nr:hypothetical protein [Acrocarpospora macrocephala]GES11936.1 hypothetical protein Amac_055330 [Acrocarpospora macrocephala]